LGFGGSAASSSFLASSIFCSTVFSAFLAFFYAKTFGFTYFFFGAAFAIFLVTFFTFFVDFAYFIDFLSSFTYFDGAAFLAFFSFYRKSYSFSATLLLADCMASSALLNFLGSSAGAFSVFSSVSAESSASDFPYFFRSFSRSSCSAIVFSASLISSE